MEVVKSFPTLGPRPHGLAWDNGFLWCADTSHKAIHKLDPQDGRTVDIIENVEPDPHGMTIYEGSLWFCDAESCQVCRIV